MTDENLLEEKCSCGASIKIVLPTERGTSGGRASLLERLDNWRSHHSGCATRAPQNHDALLAIGFDTALQACIPQLKTVVHVGSCTSWSPPFNPFRKMVDL